MKMRSKMYSGRLILILVAALAALLLSTMPALAAEPRSGERVVIAASEVVNDDLYVAANTLTVDGTINGDLIVVGGQIIINGRVTGDVLAAAQSVIVNGQIGDDLRVAGAALLLTPSARIGGDVAIGAGSIEQQSGSVVSGGLLAAAGQALLAGTIDRNVQAGFNRAELRGNIGGNANLTISGEPGDTGPFIYQPNGTLPTPNVKAGLTVAEGARIGGQLNYSAVNDGAISSAAQIVGGVSMKRLPVTEQTPTPTSVALSFLQRLVGLIVVGLLLVWLAPTWTRQLGQTAIHRALPSLGWGIVTIAGLLATLFGVLVLTIGLAVLFGYLTLGGIAAFIVSVGVLLDLLLAVGIIAYLAYVAVVVVSLAVGSWLVAVVRPSWAEQPWLPLLVGLVAYVALSALPWLGPVVGIVVVLLALGALWQWGTSVYRRGRREVPPISAPQPA